MDKAAAAFGIDPVEIRRRNLIAHVSLHVGDRPRVRRGELSRDAGHGGRARSTSRRSARGRARRAPQGRYLGIGFATFSERTGYGTPAFAARGMEITPGWETVELAMDPSGFVEARIGASPHGQGLRTTLAQIVADELGIAPDRIKVVHGDTDRTPYGWGTFASRSLVIAGGATLMAARKVRAKLIKIASHAAGSRGRRHRARRRHGAGRRHRPRDRRSPTLARAAYHQTHIGSRRDLTPGLTETATYDPAGTFSNACHVAMVEVDIETGGVRIERFWSRRMPAASSIR